MKVRNGFVSNSSSSSFCIIGVDDEDLIQRMLGAEGVEWECSYGMQTMEDGLEFYGYYERPSWAGLPAEKLLQKHNLPDAKTEFCKWVKKNLKLTIHENDVGLHFGEAGEG